MRILNSVTDPRMGGPQHRILSIADKLRPRGIETVFHIPAGDDEFTEKVRSKGYEVHRSSKYQIQKPTDITGNVKFLSSFLSMVNQTRKIIQKADIDIVHANMPINYQAAVAAYLSDADLVWHFNDTSTPTPIKQFSSTAARYLADEIIVSADAVHEYYFNSWCGSKTVYAPVNLNTFDPRSTSIDEKNLRNELGISPNVPVVGTIGNVNPLKGHEYLLRSVARLKDDIDVAVPIIGAKLESRKPYYNQLVELQSELDIEEQVKFVGYRSDIPQLLSLFDVFVLSSTAEACPMVTLEAMAMGVPVVATDVGGVKEQIPTDNHGWVVPPKEPPALASAIMEALSNSDEPLQRVYNAQERVKEKFSLHTCVEDHIDVYRSVV